MRILHVVALLSPDGAFGGPARVALNQSRELRNQGHEVTVAAATDRYPLDTPELGGVPVRLFPSRKVLPGLGFPGTAAPGLLRWFRAHRTDFDVVHIHLGRDLTTLPVAALARHKVPYVVQTHGMVTPTGHPLARPLDAMLTRRVLRGAGAVLHLTGTERRQLHELAGGGLNLVEMPNGVPAYTAATAGTGPPEVLFLGRLHARKRPRLFIEMARALLGDGVDAVFTLIGSDEGQGAAVRAALAGQPRITWTGPLPPEEVPGRLSRASVCVLPARDEPYPMAVLEAMSAAVPVVVCDDCGLAPVITETRSGIATFGAADALADAVRSVLADHDGYRRRAHDTARQRFAMAPIAARLTGVYGQVRS